MSPPACSGELHCFIKILATLIKIALVKLGF
jgi:hypothetical protein